MTTVETQGMQPIPQHSRRIPVIVELSAPHDPGDYVDRSIVYVLHLVSSVECDVSHFTDLL